MSRSELIDEMLAAISANIEFLKNNGNSQIRVKHGKFLYNVDGNFVYEFTLDYLQDIDADVEVEVKLGSRSYSGKVNAVRDTAIEIAVEHHLGDGIPMATLIISNYFLLEKLLEHLGADQNKNRQSDLFDKIFSITGSSVGYDDNFNPILNTNLNGYQESAIGSVLGSDVTYIWGPPGTGKSKTIGALIEQLVNRKQSILLIAHTNAATDNVLEKVIDVMKDHDVYNDGKIIRIGSLKAISEKIQNTMVMPHIVVEAKARPLKAEIEKLTLELNKIGHQLEKLYEIEKLEKIITANAIKLERARAKHSELKEDEQSKIDRLLKLKAILEKIEYEIDTYQSKGSFSKLFSGTNLEKLTSQKSQALYARSNVERELDSIKVQTERATSEINSLQTELSQLQESFSSIPLAYSRQEIESLKRQTKNISDQITEINKQIDAIQEMLISDAQVVVTTLTKSYMYKPILERMFDCVILDEASMAPLPAIASVSMNAKEKMVLVGDFLQLPPIAQHQVDHANKSEEEANKEQKLVDLWLKRDIFTASGIENDVNNGQDVSQGWMKQLKTQYRMHPDISYLINNLVYAKNGNDKYSLENGDNTKYKGENWLYKNPLSNSHVGIYDTSKLGTVPIKTDNGSTYNLTHALIAIRLAKEAFESDVESIGIISSYRAQVNLLKKIIADESKEFQDVVIADTVHRFQGGARKLIIFDVTSPHTNTMYDDGKDGGDDAKLINVAFSRAEDKCLILVDKDTVLKKHSASSLIRLALNIISEKSYPEVDSSEILESYKADDRTEHWLEKLHDVKDIEKEVNGSQLFDEHDFYSYFQKDVLKAEKEVIIQSAFLTVSRINQLLPIIRHVTSKGVRVFVLTRLAHEQSNNMIEQSTEGMKILESNGVILLPLSGKIHQKYSIIDRKIMWEGSLNILSQRDSSETMRRINGLKTIEQFMEFHKLDKNLGEIGVNNLIHCEVCKAPGSWYWTKKTRFGLWTFCLAGNHSPGKPPKTASDRKDYQQAKKDKSLEVAQMRKSIKLNSAGTPVCPTHGRTLQLKNGRFGEFWECPLVKECNCRANKKQLAHLFN